MESISALARGPINQDKFYRIDAIDLLRGIVMVIMALDHTRDFFHHLALTQDPLDLQKTTPILFFTRWITHFCAPVFVFLSGTSVFFQGLRKSKRELSAFLIKRGLWLIFVEVFIITLALTFNLEYSLIILQVIWAIGISMVLLGLMVWLPFKMILVMGLIIVAGHNLLDFWEVKHTGPFPVWYSFLHTSGFYQLWDGHNLGIFYPFLPWTGVMILGYCFGKIYHQGATNRNKIAVSVGLSLILVFLILRSLGVYGDRLPWSIQKNSLFTILSFINVEKYPPSLLFLCTTLGPALVLLGLIGNVRNRVTKFFIVYGRVPFLYYVFHFYILHTIAVIFFISRGHSWQEGASGVPNSPFRFIVPGEGYSLGIVYLIWLLVVIALYPVCKWFSEYKKNHRKWWLSYL